MNTIEIALTKLITEWSTPRHARHRGKATPFPLSCSIERPWCSVEQSFAALDLDIRMPADLEDFWHYAISARLFEDTEFGQWGLALLAPCDALARTRLFEGERPADYTVGDLIVGEFLGDSDLLLLRCDPDKADFGRALVALPIDPRRDWCDVAPSLSQFIERYALAQGDKFWSKDY
ncbi:SMI1/KNR4 family protein [Sorangium sp. So ce118]